jgi:hypothetical protein
MKLQGFAHIKVKTLQISKKYCFLFFCLDAKEAKNQGEPSRRPVNASTANKIMFRYAQRNFVLTPSSRAGSQPAKSMPFLLANKLLLATRAKGLEVICFY